MVRPVAGMLMLVVAVVSSAECLPIGLTSGQKAAMQHDCGTMAAESSCCTEEVESLQGFPAAKPGVGLAPVMAVVAMFTASPAAVGIAPRATVPDASAVSPPPIPIYLFVSSFRI